VLRSHPDVELLGVLDHHAAWDGQTYRDLDAVLTDQPDAVIVATPVGTHGEIVSAALGAGVHVLVEKPISGDLAVARHLVEVAQRRDRLLAVGFAERFNERLTGIPPEVQSIFTRRWLTTAPRDSAVDVVLDLAVHDVDLVRFHTGSEYSRCQVRVLRRDSDGRAVAAAVEAGLRNGIGVTHEVSWASAHAERTVTWDGPAGRQTANLLGSNHSLHGQATAFALACKTGDLGALAQGADGATALALLG
jgi:predicted dehydrogenase